MKRVLICVLFIYFLLPILASAETSAQDENRFNGFYAKTLTYATLEMPEISFQTFVPYRFSQYVGVYGWFSANNNNWAEIVGGLFFKPLAIIQFGFAGGVEQADNLWRISGYAQIGNGLNYLFGMYEYGASGSSYAIESNTVLLDWLGAGVLAQRFYGIGPRIQLNIPKYPSATLYLVPLYDFETEKYGGFVGVRFGL